MARLAALLVGLIKWTIVVISLAAVVHIAVVLYLPSFAMSRLSARLLEQGGANVAQATERPGPETKIVVRPSPDLLYSICAYDVSELPVRITSPVPNSYWSLSVYDTGTDNYLVINDKQAGGFEVDLLLKRKGTRIENPERLPVIDAITPTGVILLRSLITSEEDLEYLDALRQQSRCQAYDGSIAVDVSDVEPEPEAQEVPEAEETMLEGEAPLDQ